MRRPIRHLRWYSFDPILLGARLVPLVALAAVLLLVRNTEATRAGVVHEI